MTRQSNPFGSRNVIVDRIFSNGHRRWLRCAFDDNSGWWTVDMHQTLEDAKERWKMWGDVPVLDAADFEARAGIVQRKEHCQYNSHGSLA